MTQTSSIVLGLGEVLWDMLPEGRRCGGAPANVIYHLTRLGIPSAVVSAVGRDALGDELLEFLRSKGLSTEYISQNGLPTGTVDVTLDNGIPSYDITCPSAWDAIDLPEGLLQRLPDVSAIIWGTLAQRSAASRNAIRRILAAVPEKCMKCFDINLRQNYYDCEMIDESLEFAEVLKLNDEEVAVTGELLGIPGDLRSIVAELCRRYSLKCCICTLGAKGSLLCRDGSFTEYPVMPCQVVDTVGCGDAFLAAWCAAVLSGQSPEAGMAAGTALSAQVASQAGAMG